MKLKLLAALVVCTALSSAASAAAVVVNGTTAGGPTWNRPLAGSPPAALSGVGTAVRYQTTQLSVSTSGAYVFQSTATNPVNWDNFSFLYATSFNPAAQLTNVIVGNDDNTTIGLSGFTTNLTAGLNYVFVETGFANTDFGAYSLNISGPGTITIAGAAVPETATWAMLITGFGVVGGSMRVRRRKVSFA